MASEDTGSSSSKPIVLHIGDPVKYNLDIYKRFSADFTVIRPSLEELQRDEFVKALKEKRWGDLLGGESQRSIDLIDGAACDV
jgi:hypothetical protein